MKKPTSTDSVKSQSEFHRKLQSGQIAPLYLFEGSERYLRDRALKGLLEAAVDESARDFNYARISVAQGNLEDALALARQFPMISARRMVVVTGFESELPLVRLEADRFRRSSHPVAFGGAGTLAVQRVAKQTEQQSCRRHHEVEEHAQDDACVHVPEGMREGHPGTLDRPEERRGDQPG